MSYFCDIIHGNMAKKDLFDQDLQTASAFFKALGHPARLAILKYLAFQHGQELDIRMQMGRERSAGPESNSAPYLASPRGVQDRVRAIADDSSCMPRSCSAPMAPSWSRASMRSVSS